MRCRWPVLGHRRQSEERESQEEPHLRNFSRFAQCLERGRGGLIGVTFLEEIPDLLPKMLDSILPGAGCLTIRGCVEMIHGP